MAYILINKQDKPYSFQSFISESHTSSIIINDIDRVGAKKLLAENLGIENYELGNGYNAVIAAKSKDYNELLGERLMISCSKENFTVVLQFANLSVGEVLELIEQELKMVTAMNKTKITIEDGSYFYKTYNDFIVFSNAEIDYKQGFFEPIRYGNSDYVKIVDGAIERNLVTPLITYSSKSYKDSIKGKPVAYKEVFNLIPSDFDFAELFGSSRFEDDKKQFFNSNDGFDWCESYMGLIKKDSLEVIITPVGLTRDLKLILEEETLAKRGDSAQVNVINIASYDVLGIETELEWQNVIPELKQPVKYFTQIGNYNLVATSIESMTWVLSSWQLGNMSNKNTEIAVVLENYLPYSINWLSLKKEISGWQINGKVNTKDKMLSANISVNANAGVVEGVQNLYEIDLEFIPSKMFITTIGEEKFLLAYGDKTAALCTLDGELLFTRKWDSEIIDVQEIQDTKEVKPTFVVFTKGGMDKFTVNNKGFYGLPKSLQKTGYGGKVVRYPDAKVDRYFIGVGNELRCYEPTDGLSIVQGWIFPEMKAPLNQFIYRQVAGKDYIVIQNMLNEFMVVNRKGELRFPAKASIRAESFDNRLMGTNEATLHIQGYKKGHLYRYFLNNSVVDSTELDANLEVINQGWIYQSSVNEFWQESTNLFIRYDEFGFVKDEIIKPNQLASFAGYLSSTSNTSIFADNKNNKLYLLDKRGGLITEKPLSGSSAWASNEKILFTCAGSKLIAYELK